jgi:hypothetical protein
MSELLLRLAGDATVRATITSNGEHVFSVYDFMDLACPNNCNSWTKMKWKRLISEDSEFKDELNKIFTMEYLKSQGVTLSDIKKRRFRKTPVMTLRGLQRLMMILGGKVASEFRHIVEGVFTRYMAGDRTMLEEIRAHAVSTAPIHQAYRQALVQEPVVDEAVEKRKVERQDALLELEIQERKLALEERKSRMGVELQEKNLQVVQTFSGLMTSLNPDWKSDTRLRLQIEDSMKTAMFGGQQALITNGESLASSRSISVSQVAQELGVRLNHSESVAIGRAVAAQYRELHGEPPSKHRQWVDGAEREVNSYTERDRHLLERIVLAQTRK